MPVGRWNDVVGVKRPNLGVPQVSRSGLVAHGYNTKTTSESRRIVVPRDAKGIVRTGYRCPLVSIISYYSMTNNAARKGGGKE